jgi:sec-independent protein translocase protein TatB
MFGIGMPEMILILAVALIVIGPKKLPDLAKSLGKAMGEFKKATSDLKESMQIDTELKEVKTAFDDLGKTDQKETAPPTRAEDEKSNASVVPDAVSESGAPQERSDRAMDKLKAAFDSKDMDASVAEKDALGDDDAASPSSDPDSEARKE